MALERMGEKSAGNIIRNIENSQEESAAARASQRWAFASWASARRCSWRKQFGSLDRSPRASLDELQEAEEVGPKVAESVYQFFHEPHNRELIDRLRAAGLQFTYQSKRPTGGPLKGMTFVLTGTLPNMSREEATTADRSGRRQSERRGQPEDQLRDRWRGRRLEARQSQESRHHRH